MDKITKVIDLDLLRYEKYFIFVVVATVIIMVVTLILVKNEIKKGS